MQLLRISLREINMVVLTLLFKYKFAKKRCLQTYLLKAKIILLKTTKTNAAVRKKTSAYCLLFSLPDKMKTLNTKGENKVGHVLLNT